MWVIVMFLSAVWTLILTAQIHCRASIAERLMQSKISPNLTKEQTHLHLGWPEGEECQYVKIFISFDFFGGGGGGYFKCPLVSQQQHEL